MMTTKKKGPSLPTLDIHHLEARALDPEREKICSVLARKKLKILAAHNYACARCGTTKDLTIDHEPPLRIGKGKRTKVRYFNVDDCQVLCEKCHMRKNGWIE